MYNSPFTSYNPNGDDSKGDKVPVNLYNSPFTSYNPPPDNDGGKGGDLIPYPPNAPVDSYQPPAMEMSKKPKPVKAGDEGGYIYPTPQTNDDEDGYVYTPPPESAIKEAGQAEDDLSPPPKPIYGKIPEYLDHNPHNFQYEPYHHHDVYHEITTTTAAPPPPPRASSHYTYYYLGRKLWYIPLYFSVYFILYITYLIWKSIARHKIQLSHNHLGTASSRSARQMVDFGHVNESARQRSVNQINQTVSAAIATAAEKYIM